MAVQLRPHQQKVLPKLSSGKVLYGGVGSGKSITTAAYYMEKEAPKDVYVITTAKVRNDGSWEKEFAKFGVGTSRDATVAGVLRVDSWNNINKYKDVKNAFFIFDEQKVVGSGAWVKAFIFIAKRNNWLLLTATPGDTWIDYIPIFVANGFYRNRTEFKDLHVEYVPHVKFPKVRRYHNVGKLVRLRNSILVHMPFERHTVRHSEEIRVDFDEESFHRALVQRWHVYEERPLRNVAELFLVLRRIVNSDNSRLDAVKCLMEKHPKLIIFYHFDFELEMLRTLVETSTPHISLPSGNGHKTSEMPVSPKLGSSESSTLSLPSEEQTGEATSEPTQSHADTMSLSTTTTSDSTSASHASKKLTEQSGSSSSITTTPNSRSSREDLIGISEVDWVGLALENLRKEEEWTPGPRTTRWSPTVLKLFPNLATPSESGAIDAQSSEFSSTLQSGRSSVSTASENVLTLSTGGDLESVRTSSDGEGWIYHLDPSPSRSKASSSTEPRAEALRSSSRFPESYTTSSDSEEEPIASEKLQNLAKSTTTSTPSGLRTDTGISSEDQTEPSTTKPAPADGTFAIAEWNGHKHEPIPKTDRWVYLVNYKAGAEGWNCVETDAMVFFSLTYSYKEWHQAHGRIDRLNTPFTDLYYYILKSNSMIDRAIWKSLTAKHNFNESSFIRNVVEKGSY